MAHLSASRSLIIAAMIVASAPASVAVAQVPNATTTMSVQADPVSTAITEASQRFGVPESWIRAVMRVESAGNPVAVSRAGAMGLMQMMPGTYAELRSRYSLGADPFAVRDNVMAGTAYLREMYDRYGAPGFLAAYNAGPGRWEAYLTRGRPLPGETVDYLARLGPAIGVAPLAVPSNSASSPPSPRPPSPFAAPIFVVLHSEAGADASSATRDQLRQIVTANTAVVPTSGELFVRRQTASEQPAEAPLASTEPPVQQTAPPVPESPAAMPLPATNPLFPLRSTGSRR